MEEMKKEYEFDNNYLVDEFINYCTYGEAVEDYEWIDDIITGITLLDYGGNTRPLSRAVLYTLVSTQRTIKVSLLEEATGLSKRHCQKIAGALRIACKALEKRLRQEAREDVKLYKMANVRTK